MDSIDVLSWKKLKRMEAKQLQRRRVIIVCVQFAAAARHHRVRVTQGGGARAARPHREGEGEGVESGIAGKVVDCA